MTVRTNQLMDKYLSRIDYNFWDKTITLPKDLMLIVESEFVTNNDCIVLKAVGNIETNPKLKTSLEKCEYEDFETHFHLDLYIDTENEIEYLKLALECGKLLTRRFETDFQDKNFRLLISFSETEIIDGEIESYGSSTVRFYQIRQDCDNVMRTDDLNSFEIDAMLEIEKLQAT
jgi:hypothetical protein